MPSWKTRHPTRGHVAPFDTVVPAEALRAELEATVVTCACGERIALSDARAHAAACEATAAADVAAEEMARAQWRRHVAAHVSPQGRAEDDRPVSEPANDGYMNRVTFDCPLCGATATEAALDHPGRHLDCEALTRHLRLCHGADPIRSAVCPVCAAMPWGDPSYATRDVVAHCALRHRFEYASFVDVLADEDDVLRRVLERSAAEFTFDA